MISNVTTHDNDHDHDCDRDRAVARSLARPSLPASVAGDGRGRPDGGDRR